jgi:hypothetical protein
MAGESVGWGVLLAKDVAVSTPLMPVTVLHCLVPGVSQSRKTHTNGNLCIMICDMLSGDDITVVFLHYSFTVWTRSTPYTQYRSSLLARRGYYHAICPLARFVAALAHAHLGYPKGRPERAPRARGCQTL